MDVGELFQLDLRPTCYDGEGGEIAETVTVSITGQPTTGGARAKFVPNPVQSFSTTTLTITTSKRTDAGVYPISIGGQGSVCGAYAPYNFSLTLRPVLAMQRQDLMTVVSTGDPVNGGEFSYDVDTLSGDTVADIQMAAGVSASTNPNKAKLIEPPNPSGSGAPSPGGLASITVDYEVAGVTSVNDTSSPFQVPLFGMSCYFTTLEADWGAPPDACGRVKIGGVVYKDTITDPYGFEGTYCAAFIAEVKLQGSGVLNNGTKIQYEPSTQKIRTTKKITGGDGTEVVADATLARDRAVIPSTGVRMDVNGVGSNLLANDTGGAINDYRLDFYRGAGKGVCAHYANRMRVAVCRPSQPSTCRKGDLK